MVWLYRSSIPVVREGSCTYLLFLPAFVAVIRWGGAAPYGMKPMRRQQKNTRPLSIHIPFTVCTNLVRLSCPIQQGIQFRGFLHQFETGQSAHPQSYTTKTRVEVFLHCFMLVLLIAGTTWMKKARCNLPRQINYKVQFQGRLEFIEKCNRVCWFFFLCSKRRLGGEQVNLSCR